MILSTQPVPESEMQSGIQSGAEVILFLLEDRPWSWSSPGLLRDPAETKKDWIMKQH